MDDSEHLFLVYGIVQFGTLEGHRVEGYRSGHLLCLLKGEDSTGLKIARICGYEDLVFV